MEAIRKLFLLFAVFFTATPSHLGHKRKNNCLILVLVDGVRWDYIDADSYDYKGFKKLAKNGVKADYVNPIFPANSYPNWYTIVTGKYAESHNFVQNYMYDEKRKEYFEMAPSPNASHPHWWNGSEPLWITAEKQGIKTSMYWWDGCQVTLNGVKVSYCQNYKDYNSFDVKKETETTLLQVLGSCKKDRHSFGLVYYEPVDGEGHKYGPNSEQRKTALKHIDSILYTLQKTMKEKDLDDKVNLVVLSDHGMADSSPKTVKSINISTPAILENIEMMLDKGSMSMIMPKKGKLDQLYNIITRMKINGLKVYKKADIPNHYHFKNNDLVLPILLVADQGYYIQRIPGKRMYPDNNKTYEGFHGYDPYLKDKPDMRGIFYARGPDFKKGHKSPPLNMVDHYQVLCHLLGIQALPNNGSWQNVKSMLKSDCGCYAPVKYFTIIIAVIHIVLGLDGTKVP